MKKDKEYYFITVFRKLDIDSHGWPDFGESRCWGFYTDKDTALQAVHENWTDMEETIYHYALIESYYEGISNVAEYRQFFKFDVGKNSYVEIEEPEGYKNFKGFAIG